jgi:hypothetical protein
MAKEYAKQEISMKQSKSLAGNPRLCGKQEGKSLVENLGLCRKQVGTSEYLISSHLLSCSSLLFS